MLGGCPRKNGVLTITWGIDFTPVQMRDRLAQWIQFEFGTRQAFADQKRVSVQFVGQVLNGRKEPPPWMLRMLALHKTADGYRMGSPKAPNGAHEGRR